MRVFSLIATIFVAAVCANDEEFQPSLDGMQSITVQYKAPEQLSLLKSYEDVSGFEILKISHDLVDVLVTADQVESFKKVLHRNHMAYIVTVENVKQKVIEEYRAQVVGRRMQAQLQNYASSGRLSFTYYPDADEVNEYLEYVSRTHSDVATLINIGSSYEGREMKGLKISVNDKKKPAIFMDAGIHAREWIAPVTGLYIIDQLVANETNRQFLENVDWYIIPLANPDGYQFTHSKLRNRLWRKTRSVQSGTACRGVDGNRNFDMSWMTIGASSNPCSDTYAGTKPFSEPETQNIRDFILAHKGDIKVYLTLHSYGQYILYPWGYTTKLPSNEPELRNLALSCTKAISSVRGTRYTYGTSANQLYPSSGGSDDWAMEKGGADLSYTYELPGGSTGFILPPSQIKPVGIETFEAIRVIQQYVASKYT